MLENNYKKRNILINKVFRDSDLSNVELNKRINIYKMNGDITNPDGICKLRSNGMPVPLLRNGYSIFNGTKYR